MKQDVKTLPKWAQRLVAEKDTERRLTVEAIGGVIAEVKERRDHCENGVRTLCQTEAVFLTDLMQRLSKVGANDNGETGSDPAGTSGVDGD